MNRLWVILPSLTLTHSAAGALLTGTVAVAYMTSAVSSSPKAAMMLEPVRIFKKGSMKPRYASAPWRRPAGESQTIPSAT